jgi:hypothetical protein
MYKITKVFSQDPARHTKEIEILCTNVSDLPSLEEIDKKGIEAGSTAYVSKTKQGFILNTEKEWDAL